MWASRGSGSSSKALDDASTRPAASSSVSTTLAFDPIRRAARSKTIVSPDLASNAKQSASPRRSNCPHASTGNSSRVACDAESFGSCSGTCGSVSA